MRNSIFIIILSLGFMAQSQVGIQFPEMQGESLRGKVIDIPDELKGKYSIIGLAYSKKSEVDLKSWYQPTYREFIHDPKTPNLFDISYDVNLFFVPMFSGAKKAAYKSIMEKVRKTLDPKLHPHVLFYKGEIKTYKKALNFKGKDVPYFFLLNEEGQIVYTTNGGFSQSKMQQIIDKLNETW